MAKPVETLGLSSANDVKPLKVLTKENLISLLTPHLSGIVVKD